MTSREAETLAKLSQKVSDMARQLDQNTKDTQAIKSIVDSWSGGKQALMWFIGLIVSVGVIVTTWIGVHHK